MWSLGKWMQTKWQVAIAATFDCAVQLSVVLFINSDMLAKVSRFQKKVYVCQCHFPQENPWAPQTSGWISVYIGVSLKADRQVLTGSVKVSYRVTWHSTHPPNCWNYPVVWARRSAIQTFYHEVSLWSQLQVAILGTAAFSSTSGCNSSNNFQKQSVANQIRKIIMIIMLI